jgi:hypothetical protein
MLFPPVESVNGNDSRKALDHCADAGARHHPSDGSDVAVNRA